MALITQIRLPSITGSMGTSGKDVNASNLGRQTPLDSISGGGVSEILQRFADAVGKISGFPDWTDSKQGMIVSMPGAARDLALMQTQGNRSIELESSGSLNITKVGTGGGHGGPLIIRTGDGGPATPQSGNVEIMAQQRLVLSSSNGGGNAVEIVAPQGGFQAQVQDEVKLFSAGAGVTIAGSGSGTGVKIESAAPNSSIMLSASLGYANDHNAGVNSTVDVVSKRGIAFHTSGSHNTGTMSTWGLVGPQIMPGAGDGWFQVTGMNQSVRIGAESHINGGGKLFLSGARNVYFSDSGSSAAGIDQGFGPGSWAMSAPGDFANFVTNFGGPSVSLVGALNVLAGGIAGTEPSLFGAQIAAPTGAGAQISLGHRAGSPATLGNHLPNTVQVMLNGQLLLSASGPGDGSAVNPDGDYYIEGNGTSNKMRFGFALEVGDQIQIWDLA